MPENKVLLYFRKAYKKARHLRRRERMEKRNNRGKWWLELELLNPDDKPFPPPPKGVKWDA